MSEERTNPTPPAYGEEPDGATIADPRASGSSPQSGNVDPEGSTGLPDLMTLILSELRSIRANLEERGSRDAVKDEAFDRLYESLDASQRARTLGDLRGILQDLFLFHDRIDQIRRETDESSLSDLTSLHQELLEILERQGVQVLTESSARFDPGFQTVVGFEPCDQADLDGTVLRVVRNGFRSGDVLMRAQDVVLARYRRESTGSKEPDSSGDSESSFVTKEAKPQ